MKRRIVFLELILGLIINVPEKIFSQNLIVNPSFEDTVSCPIAPTYLWCVIGWSSYNNTPDYFNICSQSCGSSQGLCVGVPRNFAGFQMPYQENAYLGITTYNLEFPSVREMVGSALINPLVVGKKYFVSAYFSRGNDFTLYGATNNLGFRFSTVQYDVNHPCPIDNFSHIHCDSILTDSISWTQIWGSIIADSAYQYLIIGNFYDDLHTDTIDMSINFPHGYAYYYIDNVCVTEDSTSCNVISNIHNNLPPVEFNIFPNPFEERLNIESMKNDLFHIFLYDIYFRKKVEQIFTGSTIIDSENLKKGVYIFEIWNNMALKKRGLVIKN